MNLKELKEDIDIYYQDYFIHSEDLKNQVFDIILDSIDRKSDESFTSEHLINILVESFNFNWDDFLSKLTRVTDSLKEAVEEFPEVEDTIEFSLVCYKLNKTLDEAKRIKDKTNAELNSSEDILSTINRLIIDLINKKLDLVTDSYYAYYFLKSIENDRKL